MIGYQVTGSDGTAGVLTSVLDSSSKVQATVSTRIINERQFRNRVRFVGRINIDLDYSNATRAGEYSGVITTTVECL